MARFSLLICALLTLGGCGVVSAGASVVGAAVDVAGSAAGAAIDVTGAVASGAVGLATSDGDDDETEKADNSGSNSDDGTNPD